MCSRTASEESFRREADDTRWAGRTWFVSIRRQLQRWGYRSGSARGDAGFTLVEVIVALAILSAGLSLALAMISSALQRAASAERIATAGLIAQSLMAKVGTELPMMPEERDGTYLDRYRWRVIMRPLAEADQSEARFGLYSVSTEVEWWEGADIRSFVLSTLRVGPKVKRR